MKICREEDYALRIVLYLAQKQSGYKANAQELGKEMSITIGFVKRIANALKHEGILQTSRGCQGGYLLARPPAKISLLDVIEGITGPIEINGCLLDPNNCSRNAADYCPICAKLRKLRENWRADLANVRFDEMRLEK